MAAQNNFDFDAYNAITKKAPMGLKLHLGIQMIRDVVSGLEHFDNPLEAELRPILVDLKAFHLMYKEAAKNNAAKKSNESERTAGTDNSTIPQIGVQDMMKMFEQFQKMQAAMVAGELAKAQTAQTSIEQIQDGALHQQGDQATGTNG